MAEPTLAALGLFFARPAALVSLVLPLVVLALALQRTRPTARATGTLEWWEQQGARGAQRRRRRPPFATWMTVAALLAGALAWAGPRSVRPLPRTWTVVVDTRPSMALPAPAPDGSEEAGPAAAGPDGRPTRAARGVERTRLAAARAARAGDRVRWLAEGAEELLLEPGQAPPAPWIAALPQLGSGAFWQAHDRPGTWFVTDLAPEPGPERAGVVATGAASTPGPIGADGEDLLVWDGARIVRRRGAAPRRSVLLRGALPGPLERVLAAWAGARGLLLVEQAGADTVLVVAGVGAPESARAVRCERDGWSAGGRASRLVDSGSTWLVGTLADGTALPVVTTRRGELASSLVTLDEPAGDPAAFAVSWSTLLDRSCRPPRGTVPLEERRRSGPALERTPLPPSAAADERADQGLVDAWLASLAVLCALGALAARR